MSLTRTPRAAAFAAVVLLTLLGCKAETFGGEDPVIDPAALQVVAGARLPGARLTISAPWMAHLADTVTLVIDDRKQLLAVRDTGGPDRFFLYLPDTLPAGAHLLSWQASASVRTPVGQVSTGGFTQLRYVTGSFYGGYGAVQPLPELVSIAGEGDPFVGGCKVVLLDARHAQLTQVGSSPNCGYGLGASFRPASFLQLWDENSAWSWARTSPTPTGVVTESLQVYGNHWPKHELAPDLYLGDEKQQTFIKLDSASFQYLDNYYHPARIAFSPDGRWAVSSHSRSYLGALIVDRSARSFLWSPGWIAYTFPLFLPDGRLVLYGWRRDPDYDPAKYGPNGEYLAHVDPASGALLDSVRFGDSGSPYNQPLALGSGPIVMPGWTGGHIELSFRDPNTLLEIAHVRSPDFAASCYFDSTVPTVEDRGTRRIYFALDDCYSSVPVWTFQLPD